MHRSLCKSDCGRAASTNLSFGGMGRCNSGGMMEKHFHRVGLNELALT
jgi:hypothetical protein